MADRRRPHRLPAPSRELRPQPPAARHRPLPCSRHIVHRSRLPPPPPAPPLFTFHVHPRPFRPPTVSLPDPLLDLSLVYLTTRPQNPVQRSVLSLHQR